MNLEEIWKRIDETESPLVTRSDDGLFYAINNISIVIDSSVAYAEIFVDTKLAFKVDGDLQYNKYFLLILNKIKYLADKNIIEMIWNQTN